MGSEVNPGRPAVDKAIVLARGLGSRMRQGADVALRADQASAADAGAKAMMPIGPDGAARPFLDYVLSGLADAGVRSVCLVIGPDHDGVRRYYGDVAPPARLAIDYAVQAEPRGTADAVAAATDFMAGDHALVINGDNYYPTATLRALRQMGRAATALFRASSLIAGSNIPADRIRAFAVCRLAADGRLDRIIEKPGDAELRDAGPDPLVSMNCWLMPPEIGRACRAIAPSARGELELAHAVTFAITTLGTRFDVLVSEEAVLDLSRRGDVATVAERLAGSLTGP